MSSELDFVLNILMYASLLVFVYSGYWALNIRRALSVGLYRKQALAVALISVMILIAALPSPGPGFAGTLGNDLLLTGYLTVTAVFWLGTLYVADASVLVSRRSDPLNRDTIYWSKLRYILWSVQIFFVFFILLGFAISGLTQNATLANQLLEGNNGALTTIPAVIVNLAWFLAFASLISFVPIAIRTKDLTLRRHFRWLALTAVVGVGSLGFIGVASTLYGAELNILGNIFGFLLTGYFLYRAAKALVPLNRISMEEIENRAS